MVARGGGWEEERVGSRDEACRMRTEGASSGGDKTISEPARSDGCTIAYCMC